MSSDGCFSIEQVIPSTSVARKPLHMHERDRNIDFRAFSRADACGTANLSGGILASSDDVSVYHALATTARRRSASGT